MKKISMFLSGILFLFYDPMNIGNLISLFSTSSLLFLGIGMKTDLFKSFGHCWVFQICWHIECNTFTIASFRIWNSSSGIPSPPPALFVVILPKAQLTSTPGCLALGDWWHHCGYLDHSDLVCVLLLGIIVSSSNIFCFCQIFAISVSFLKKICFPFWERSDFISIRKNGNAKECSSYYTVAFISNASKVMLKILGISSMWTESFHKYKRDLEKTEVPEVKLPTSAGS